MTHICTICKRELPDEDFYPTYLKNYKYQCKECKRKENRKYLKDVKELDSKDFDNYYGGYMVAILNHVKAKEYKYTIKGTNGFMIQTNDIDYFKKKMDEICQEPKLVK